MKKLHIINESYKTGKYYVTLWGATEMLSYVGAVIGATGTIFIGIIAISQSERANKISDKLLKMEEVKLVPYLHLDTVSCKVDSFREHEVDITLGFRNETDSVINVVSVAPLHMEAFFSTKKTEIKFADNWTEHFSVLPHRTRQFNFFDESREEAQPIIDLSEKTYTEGFLSFTCKLAVKIKFVNSIDIYQQKYEFHIQMRNLNGKQEAHNRFPTIFNNVENSICKELTKDK